METLQAWGPFAVIRAGEGRSVAVFSTYAFVLLVSYYVLKTLREPLLLAQGSAELKSYANATIAGVLLLLVPLYAGLFRRLGGRRLFQILTAFFALSLAGLGALGASGVAIGFYYYVWVGVFGLTVLAQFWAHAAHAYGVERGQRLFPMIMIGSVSGGLVGPAVYSQAVVFLGAWNLIGVMVIVLLGTWALIGKMGTTAGSGSALVAPETPQPRAGLLGGFSLVLGDRYLLSLAVLTVLLNCVNTMGEYMLAELVLRHMDARIAADPTLERDAAIGTFYARYYFSVNLLTVSLQVLLVGRLFSTLGVRGTMLLLPVIAIVSYGLVAFLPVFALVRVVKIVENAADYSLMNTVRHALYLPLPVAHKYQGKTAIDTFFWRFGDLLQAGIVFAGLHWLGFEFRHFALLNMALASGWLLLALRIGRMYGHRAEHQCGTEPELCTDRQPRRDRRRFKRALATGAAACVAVALPVVATADTSTLFEDPSVLEVQLTMNLRALCRDPNRPGCEDVPAVLSVPTSSGAAMVEATVRSRGRWRTARCSFPALFLFFDRGTTAGTIFDGHAMLPLTTHCERHSRIHEQYVLAEYFAYRLFNALTPASLRVRLARIHYRDARRPERALTRYAFFIEHFETLGARLGARVAEDKRFEPAAADPLELGRLELFQLMIGNTDWSVVYGHNVVVLERTSGPPIAVPYDFDYSGLVDADYAVPSPKLRLRDVRQRLFRGFCRPDAVWDALLTELEQAWPKFETMAAEVPGWDRARRGRAWAYLAQFHRPGTARDGIVAAIAESCRTLER